MYEKRKRCFVSNHRINHTLFLSKSELVLAQIQACYRLLKYSKDDDEANLLREEMTKLNLVLDLISY